MAYNWRQAALDAGEDVNSPKYASYRAAEQQSSPSSSLSVGNIDDYIKKFTESQKKAIEPAVQSYQASIPETQQRYQQTRTQLEQRRVPMQERYKNLVASIKGQGEQDINSQTKVTSNELGRRGIVGSSGLAEQTIQDAVSPLRQKYTGLEKDAVLAGEEAEMGLNEQISGLTSQETDALRAIQNAIAGLQSGAISQGNQLGANLYQTDLQSALQRQQMEEASRQAAIQSALAQSQLDFTKTKDERDFAEQQRQFQIQQANKGGSDGGLGALFSQLGLGNTQKKAPTKTVVGRLADGRYLWSDGSAGWSGGK